MKHARVTLYSALLIAVMVAAAIYSNLALPPPIPLVQPIDRILIEKSQRRMTLFREGAALRVYTVTLGFAPDGDKERQGDGRTPEGIFRIDRKNPDSRFYLSLGINYPRREDLIRAAAGGYSAGGDIFIHGQPDGILPQQWIGFDWTAGCVAVSNAVMDELWRVVAIGTEVEIRP